ncbi:MAG: ABC transporter permease [Armatimonadota bacterium]|nr:ABC transporter permease [Armatimonadota bacterium]MDR7449830.1 ABC transporter permease [Armatimonadota bacterium]MDR7460082.1 ABC transporter permease [Armatimonadota bacterium]MDR7480638.1 ABC transporter permease [Armatimonadota bacterium]MDR7488372.1 ABC transporter permease [Armatimonadota bacterium]
MLRRLLRWHPGGVLAAAVLAGLLVASLGAPWLAPHDPYAQDYNALMRPPGTHYPLGTDYLGRDVLSRTLYGGRTSLLISLASIGVGTVAGTAVGLLSGYYGGWLDGAVQRVVDVLMALPAIILALALMAVLGPRLENVVLAIAIVVLPGLARVVRGVVLQLREFQFVEAARALGASDARLLLRHLLPNAVAPVIVLATNALSAAILIEASLSFLGLGTQPPVPSWGNMLSEEARRYFEQAPWMALPPGVALSLAVLAVNFLGDALRDALDPRLRRSGA